MRRAAVIAACVAGLVLATAPAALGDPPKPLYRVDCPAARTMTCIVSELHEGGEVFEVAFLIKPATH